MKRFVVIITSLLIIFVFIALNYLLWDRESLVTQGESNEASIDALTRMNMSLNQEKSKLEQQAEELKGQIETLNEKMNGLEQDILQQKQTTDDKTRFILSMKEHIDPLPVRTMALDLINNLHEKKYSDAFLKGGANCSFWGNYWTLRIFSDYFDQNVEQIELVLDENSLPEAEIIPIKTPDWEMSVYVRVHVMLKEGARQDYLKQGENILHLACTYNEKFEQWTITSVFSEEVTSKEPVQEEKTDKGKE